jgi:hypothetical protein
VKCVEQNNSINKKLFMKSSLHVKFGIGAALINCIAWYTFSKSLTYYEVAAIDKYRLLTTIGLLLIGIPLSIFFNRKENNGFLEFKGGFKTGMLYTLLLASVLAVFNYLYYKFIAPDAIDYYVADAKNQILSQKIKPEDLPKFEEAVRNYFSSFKMFMSTVLMGLVVSLATAGILQRKGPSIPFSEN